MKRPQYLAQSDVREFSAWFAAALTNRNIRHQYSLPGSTRVVFEGLEDALRKYDWPFRLTPPGGAAIRGSTYKNNANALDGLKSGLSTSIKARNDAGVRDWCIAVMEWGGVRNGNVKWLQANTSGLTVHVTTAKNALGSGSDDKVALRKSVTRFNAGMTKVYSLLVDDFVIYDSRVAAALSWFVAKWCHEEGKEGVPASLQFLCMRPKEGDNPAVRKSRNPSCGKFQFPWMSGATTHAHWNIRASWLLSDALARANSSLFHRTAPNPLRALEAALFMWGYDLSQNAVCTRAAEDAEESISTPRNVEKPIEPSQIEWRKATTRGGKAKDFKWRCDETKDALVVTRKLQNREEEYSFAELFRVIHQLYDRFGYDWFPLANSLTKLQDGTERQGLGMSLFESYSGVPSARVSHAQGASQIGVVLEALRIVEWNRESRGIQWRLKVEPPETIEELRMMMSAQA